MNVELINYTQNAKDLLIFTKNTRLNMAASFEQVELMDEQEKQDQLDYMVNTIKSSWEFVDFTFNVTGVTRAFTHQLVRNRHGSYAQQTMRILEMEGFKYVTGPTIRNEYQKSLYDAAMESIQYAYDNLIESGVSIEDARGILPTNICTNITVKFNLRTLSDMMASRASCRTQGEYRDVLNDMYDLCVSALPWIAPFLRDSKTHACNQLESIIKDRWDGTTVCTDYVKLIDIVRNSK